MMEAVSKWLSPILLGVLLGVAGLAIEAWVIGEIDPKAVAVGVAGSFAFAVLAMSLRRP
jgi:hypothetical protein